jgi:Kef-type K+ transport system membrane component KefB
LPFPWLVSPSPQFRRRNLCANLSSTLSTPPSIMATFVLFVAVAVGITAFPVLCRILTETRLLNTTVGVLVLSAGVGNDVTE